MLTLLAIAVVILVLCNVAILAVVLAAIGRAARLVSSLQDQARAFFESPDASTPSAFADLIDKGSAILAARVVSSAQAALRGSAGGAAKAAAAEQQAELFQGNPLAGLLSGKLGKSPLATIALSLLGNKLFGAGNSGGTPALPAGNGSKPKFNL